MNRLVFGCGYLGSRVAARWVNAGDTVYAITRSSSRAQTLISNGMTPILADVTDPTTLVGLPQCETVLFAVGMDRSTYSNIRDVYVDGLKNAICRLSDKTEQLIYVSSTGVYGDFNGDWVNENSPTVPTREGGQACLEAEGLLKSSRFGRLATILRFAGIYGPGRVPTGELIRSKKWEKLSAEGYLNLIQVDDGAQIIARIADQTPTGETFNVSDGSPPLRRAYYETIARHYGLNEIPWNESGSESVNARSAASKRVSNQKLVDRFGIKFEFDNYETGLLNALDSPK